MIIAIILIRGFKHDHMQVHACIKKMLLFILIWRKSFNWWKNDQSLVKNIKTNKKVSYEGIEPKGVEPRTSPVTTTTMHDLPQHYYFICVG